MTATLTSWRLTMFLWAFVSAISARPASAQSLSRVFTGSDLFSLEIAADPEISPDGRTIAYVRKSNDIMTDKAHSTIWLVDVATGRQRPLVSGPGSYSYPRWSPEGTRIAYLRAEADEPQIYVEWLATGTSTRITGVSGSPHDIAWSPNGRRIAYSMFVPGKEPSLGSAPKKPQGAKWADPLQIIDAVTYRADGEGYRKSGYEQIFWVPADGGAAVQVTFGATNAGGPLAWTPDGGSIIFSANLSKKWQHEPINDELHRIDVDSGSPVALTDRDGPDEAPAVSPDGRHLAWIGFNDRHVIYQNSQLSVMNLDGSDKRVLSASLDRTVDSFVWAPDSHSLFVAYEDRGTNKIARIGLDGSFHPVVSGLAGTVVDRPYSGATGGAGQFSIARNGDIAALIGDALRPANIAIVKGGSARQLTDLNEALFSTKTLAALQKLPVASAFDQRPIDAWMLTPPDFDPKKKYPLILEIHGGPNSAYGAQFSADDQLYAAHGYVVVYSNPRGSTSYGEEFANLNNKDFPGHDFDDLMSVVDAAIATGHVDSDNLFVTGGSAGGILTAWIIGKTGRFRAAAVQKPAINFSSFALTSDGANFYSPYWFAKEPWEDPTGYWSHSPLSLVGNVTTPTIVVVGSEDYRSPASEAEQYYEALQLRRIPTMLIKVPGASHSIAARPSQSAARVSAILAWFDRYRTQGHLVVRATVFEAAPANTSGSTSPVNQRIAHQTDRASL